LRIAAGAGLRILKSPKQHNVEWKKESAAAVGRNLSELEIDFYSLIGCTIP